jgi:hypothetical protein
MHAKIKPLIEEYLKGNTSLVLIAQHFCISRIKLSSICKEIYGPAEWRKLKTQTDNLAAKKRMAKFRASQRTT